MNTNRTGLLGNIVVHEGHRHDVVHWIANAPNQLTEGKEKDGRPDGGASTVLIAVLTGALTGVANSYSREGGRGRGGGGGRSWGDVQKEGKCTWSGRPLHEVLRRTVDEVGRGGDETGGGDDQLASADQLGAVEADGVVAHNGAEQHHADVVGDVDEGLRWKQKITKI